jgi:hypothetical protein
MSGHHNMEIEVASGDAEQRFERADMLATSGAKTRAKA